MKNFYFRSILLNFIISGLVFVLGCSYVPSIIPVKNAASISQTVVDVKPEQSPEHIDKEIEGTNQQVNYPTNPDEQQQGNDADNDAGDEQQQVDDASNDASDDASGEQQQVNDAGNNAGGEQQQVNDAGNNAGDEQHQDDLIVDFDEKPIITIEPSDDEEDAKVNSNEQESDLPKRIAITFDDGPDLKYTPQILDILKEKNVKATFFIVGVQINKYPEIVQRMVEEGHLIGNHSYYHSDFTTLSKDKLVAEIESTDQLIQAAVGFVPEIVRPPYGAINDSVRAILKELGKEVVLWNIDPRDWASTPTDKMYDNVMANAKDNGNILFHSFGGKQIQNTVELLPRIIDDLQKQGYIFVTTNELE